MSVYKVAQDVEADDKLIGPFSFRQFIYLIVVAIAIGLAWGLFQVFPPLVIIPMPVIIFFGAIALPLRKDQPMEIYLAAVVSFHLKPKKRLWVPDGIQSLVEITAPKVVEVSRKKDIDKDEAEKRFSYLASIMDTQGWAIRDSALLNPIHKTEGNAMISDVYNEAQQTPDYFDADSGVAQSFDNMISQSDNRRRQEIINKMHSTPAAQQESTQPTQSSSQMQYPQPSQPLYQAPQADYQPYAAPQDYTASQPEVSASYPQPSTITEINLPAPQGSIEEPHLSFNPYPTAIHQSVIQPGGGQVSQPAPVTSERVPEPQYTPPAPQPESSSEIEATPDIINLANNSDLSIETIAHEAKRIKEKKLDEGDEVVISLH